MAAIPWMSHKDCQMLVGLQSAKGVAATTFYAIPTGVDEQEIDISPEFTFFQYGAGYRGMTHYEWTDVIEGKLAIPFVPGYTGTGDIYDWVFGRDATPYFQGRYATVCKVMGNATASNYRVERYLDVKVKGGEIPVDFGMEYAKMVLDVQGLALPTSPAAPAIDTTLLTTAPYRYNEAAIRLDPGTGALAAEVYTRNHSLKFDNKLELQQLLNESTLPIDAPNIEWVDWEGTFDRPFVDETIRDAFVNMTEVQYELTLTRGGTVATFLMDRILYTKAPLNPQTTGVVKQNGIAFRALCDLADDTKQPCQISESVGS